MLSKMLSQWIKSEEVLLLEWLNIATVGQPVKGKYLDRLAYNFNIIRGVEETKTGRLRHEKDESLRKRIRSRIESFGRPYSQRS